MIVLAALVLAASPAAAPHLAEPAEPRAELRHVSASLPGEDPCRDRAAGTRLGGDRRAVSLDPAFFHTLDSGGVGRDPVIHAPVRRLVLIAPSHPPRSAGREAARRGLGRE